jgi:hypothetical protein
MTAPAPDFSTGPDRVKFAHLTIFRRWCRRPAHRLAGDDDHVALADDALRDQQVFRLFSTAALGAFCIR